MGRIPASDRTRELLKALKEGKERWAIRARPWCACGPLILEEGLEGEATDAVGPRPCENSTRYNRTRNFEACGHAQSKKMQKFLLRSALQPN
jgi:hypothetical protein